MTETTLEPVGRLRDAVAATEFSTNPTAEAEARAVVAQIDAPLLAVVGQSVITGLPANRALHDSECVADHEVGLGVAQHIGALAGTR